MSGLSQNEAIEARRAYFATDIEGFCRYYLSHYFTAPFEDYHRDLLLLRHGVRELPRGHAKSTSLMAVLMHAGCYGWRRFMLLVSDTATQAEDFAARIRAEFDGNEAIREDFGEMRGDKWTSRHFTLSNGVTYKARGAGCAVRGIVERQHRPDLLVVDDLEDDEAVQTPERREKLWRWLTTALWNVGGFQGCDKIVIGTPLHNDCVLRRLSRDGWDYLRRPALEDGRPLWPGAWSLEALDLRKREIGSLAFAQEFLLQPLDEGAHPFRREWFQFYDPTAPRDGWDVVAFVDPAIGQKKGSDWFVASVVAVSHPGARLEMRLLEQWSGKLSVAQQVERIAHIARTWRPSQIGVETNAYQDSLRQLVQEHFRRTSVYAEVIPITSHAQKNVRIRKLSPAVEFGDLRFDAAQHGDLIAHMCDYPSVTHDDFEDSLAGAVEMVRRTGRLAV